MGPMRALTWLWRGARRLADARARSEIATRRRHRDRIHQDVTLTRIDRYPRLFAAARDLLADRPRPTLLSYGCSSGEEVVSLRGYFPDADIVGAELNCAMLAACARWPHDPRTRFLASDDAGVAAAGPYDAIFCMAVLQRRPHGVENEGRETIADFYPFALFDRQVAELAALLKTGGLLIVEHAQYLVTDASAAPLLEPVGDRGVWPAKGPRFDRDGRRIVPQPTIARLYRRRAA
ncbi:hypothetical protein M9980_11490 [Sphingomonas donggukensis]|uniref:Methyltransferase domain-containing protein n=1 Tax=Sphingomonas donggukensis TaxID=2949093 RepID=A0ABY4TRZ1_9SPHN|nr:hypothetical protein [Sphingomonas donggukensis]URW75164.1 hypothetical protein M9980_11490 [Sphingomonas donggukensis]